MSYRQELEELVQQLRDEADSLAGVEDPPATLALWCEKRRRQAEVLDFLVNHTKDAIGALDA